LAVLITPQFRTFRFNANLGENLNGIDPMQSTSETVLDGLVRSLAEAPQLFFLSAAAAIEFLLTLGGRTNLQDRMFSLADLDLAIFRKLLERPQTKLSKTDDNGGEYQSLRVYLNTLGRLHIRPVDQQLILYEVGKTVSVGFVNLSHADFSEARYLACHEDISEHEQRADLDRALRRVETSGTLDLLLKSVIDAVQHVEAVCLYADDRLFGVFERFANLVMTKKGPGLLDELYGKSLASWPATERLLVAALYALFLSGQSIRFEEFNGTMLSARRLFSRLSELGAAYCCALGVSDDPPKDIFALGRWIGDLALRIQAPPSLRYRRTCGLTFQKREFMCDLDASDNGPVAPELLLDLSRQWCRSTASCYCSATTLVEILANHALDDISADRSSSVVDIGSAASTKLEQLVEAIVASAVTATNSDYGMSSSVREPGTFFRTSLNEVWFSVLDLAPKDFFCCVVGTERLLQRYGPRLRTDVFRAVQARMQFNRWHFIAGNLPRVAVPGERHYFYPPSMPDLAEWSDQYHAGHTRAGVRFAVRAPGPDAGLPPLRIGNIEFRGFYDVRVVRTEGEPFTLRDLKTVRDHCLWMGLLWHRIISRCEKSEIARNRIRFTGFVNGCGGVLDQHRRILSRSPTGQW
jgi:hypothetical protein